MKHILRMLDCLYDLLLASAIVLVSLLILLSYFRDYVPREQWPEAVSHTLVMPENR